MFVILNLRKDNFILVRISLYCLGIWGEAELFLGIWGAKANTFREKRTLFAGRRGDQCIIFRDQGSTDPPGGPQSYQDGVWFRPDAECSILYLVAIPHPVCNIRHWGYLSFLYPVNLSGDRDASSTNFNDFAFLQHPG